MAHEPKKPPVDSLSETRRLLDLTTAEGSEGARIMEAKRNAAPPDEPGRTEADE